ncbi:hypothetical protein CVT25_008555 [Psilocybe cyanescens]|uniref:Uncharacterized protein n=1 Tax=Psilocybe cyanescens TaxID=93625 RepID=A0A409WAD7_PSICY|nr:hypothetical protein CVT25_008555 [Psilocybe cyanescens]
MATTNNSSSNGVIGVLSSLRRQHFWRASVPPAYIESACVGEDAYRSVILGVGMGCRIDDQRRQGTHRPLELPHTLNTHIIPIPIPLAFAANFYDERGPIVPRHHSVPQRAEPDIYYILQARACTFQFSFERAGHGFEGVSGGREQEIEE